MSFYESNMSYLAFISPNFVVIVLPLYKEILIIKLIVPVYTISTLMLLTSQIKACRSLRFLEFALK